MQTYVHTDKQENRHIELDIRTGSHIVRQVGIQASKIHIGRQVCRQADKQAGKQS